jgi:uncharacterized protein YdeI (YjbR/CyaY-like superfamily)
MAAKKLKTLDVPSREAWRAWLAEHHASVVEVWLVFHKQPTGRPTIAYEDAVDEALCYGWIDGLIKRLDQSRYARKFTPRKPDSRWSTINRRRYARLKAEGRLMPAGIARPPTSRSGDAPLPKSTRLPRYIQQALAKNAAARKYFESLAPSYRRLYVLWIDSAKQQATKQKRLAKAIAMLAAGQKLGLK